ncbi:hypothetical protein OC845_002851 [Tilletia horrida]|nr:hypothetical protein OC845_002851 [Tilletia horrida]
MSYVQGIWEVFCEPALVRVGLVHPGGGDPTYGRLKVGYTAREKKNIYDNPRILVTERRIPAGLIEEGHRSAEAEHAQKVGKKAGIGESTWYNIWEIPEAIQKARLNADVVLVHGMNDYGGKLGPLAMPYLEAGFRVIVFDLPGHGRSTGVHGFVPDMKMLPEALHAVMRDVLKQDGEAARGRKMFLTGTSMGGFTCLYYAALYPAIPKAGLNGSAEAEGGQEAANGVVPAETDEILRPNLAGVAVTAPMLGISAESMPPYIVHKIAEGIAFVAGRLPLVNGVKGNTSDDPRTDEEFHKDPLTYKGRVRVATGLAIWEGIAHLQSIPDRITCPVALHHGSKDRATDPQRTRDFFPRLGSTKKTLKIWPGYEHIMQKFVDGMDEADLKKSLAIIHEMRDFFLELAKKD